MNVDELSETEREALTAAVSLLANVDGRVGYREREEIEALAEELEDPDLPKRLAAAAETIQTLDDLLPLVVRVVRPDAREIIRTILFDLAHADGQRTDAENEILDLVTREWARR